MSCLTRIGCATVLVVGTAAGYWLYGDRLPSVASRAARSAADRVAELVASGSARFDRTDGQQVASDEAERRDVNRRARDAALGWVTIGAADAPPARGDEAASRAVGGAPGNAAYTTLSARELAGVLAPLVRQLPPSARRVQVALNRDLLLVRADVAVRDVAGEGALASLIGSALDRRDTVWLAGPLGAVRPGLAQFRVQELRLGGFDVPTRLIPSLVGVLRERARQRGNDAQVNGAPGTDANGTTGTPTAVREAPLADNGLPIPLPPSVADVRVVAGKLTVYRAVRAGSATSTPRSTP